MRICASLSSYEESGSASEADMIEIRLDLLDKIPETDRELLVTFRGDVDLSVLPEGYDGMIDIGENEIPETDLRTISSFHDYESTPSSDNISDILERMGGDIRKGAFMVRTFSDLHNIFTAASSMKTEHVILGMGEMGTVTRIRQQLLGNAFTFGYVGAPTAPGQLSVDRMRELGDDCTILGIIGNPLMKSQSPTMQNAALESAGINGMYLKFDCEDTEHVCDVIREYDIRGVNVTIPHKQNIIQQMDTMDHNADAVGAVNTVVNTNGILKGYNTDLVGIETAMMNADFKPNGRRAVIMGSGGAARACAYTLTGRGCHVTITGRNTAKASGLAKEMGCEFRPKESVSVGMYDLIVNCTPVGMYDTGEYPLKLEHLNRGQTVFDMVYGYETPLITKARVAGAGIISGADMLAGQGAASFGLWTGDQNQYSIMRKVLE